MIIRKCIYGAVFIPFTSASRLLRPMASLPMGMARRAADYRNYRKAYSAIRLQWKGRSIDDPPVNLAMSEHCRGGQTPPALIGATLVGGGKPDNSDVGDAVGIIVAYAVSRQVADRAPYISRFFIGRGIPNRTTEWPPGAATCLKRRTSAHRPSRKP